MKYNSIIVKGLSYLLFYLLVIISFLPSRLLYILSDLLSFILNHILGYRKKVVIRNLKDSLPAESDTQNVMKMFYSFLADVVMESIMCLSITKINLLKRITCDNPEVMKRFANENRSVILMSGHYGNWEFLIYALNLLFPHQAIGVGKPMSNGVLNKLTNGKRSKTGMKIINAANIKEEFKKNKDILTASLFLSDQFPGGSKKGFPVIFLNKKTEFPFGAEKYSVEYNYPVVYADVYRRKRGQYNIHLTEIAENPKMTEYGQIMKRYCSLMEETIIREPQYWLWSHKRWKQLEGFYD
jgi:KDO2-lipid IV(A) lauroyltransferase